MAVTPPIPERLAVRGARQNNLKGVDVDIPHRLLVAVTGVSGSGKSTLAFDTIYAEGQRRHVQSLSSFARQFMGEMDRPDVERIDGLCPAVAVEQRPASRNPRSTVGTATEVYDLLRVIYARIGVPHCLSCAAALTDTMGDRTGWACPEGHATPVPELYARSFSFNLGFGVCPDCEGLGTRMRVDPALIVTDDGRSLDGGALAPWQPGTAEPELMVAAAYLAGAGADTETPWRDLPEPVRETLLYGENVTVRAGRPGKRRDAALTGVVPWLYRRYRDAESENARERVAAYMRPAPCPACDGGRLSPAQLAVTVGGRSIAEVSALPVTDCRRFADELRSGGLTERESSTVAQALDELTAGLDHLAEVGLGYLTLDRAAPTLSGGEAQRVRLAGQLGTGLFGLLYVLDEPTIGLHPRDVDRLLAGLRRLRDQGNTVLVVEHDHAVIRAADWIVDLGPAAGEEGGRVIYSGEPGDLLTDRESVTGRYLSGRTTVPIPNRRTGDDGRLLVRGAREHNLTGFDAAFPLRRLIAVTGVSGSGKSTLVDDIVYRAVARRLGVVAMPPGEHDAIEATDWPGRVARDDQSPIGRTPRSNPASYTGALDPIRKLFAATPRARERGYKPGRFSFNVAGGRCEECAGDGSVRVEMHFLPDVFLPCDVCHGRRFNAETLEVTYRDHTIADVLGLSVAQARELFADAPAVDRPLAALADVGLGYLRLGQPATTLSGGEAQRLKLANELRAASSEHTLYVLDEPTAGLHTDDVRRLLGVLHRLVDAGNTVIAVEHDLDVIASADWVIDLGPEGGADGGRVLVAGTPEEVAAAPESRTGQHLRTVLGT